MKGAAWTICLVAVLALTGGAKADFEGCYAPANWTFYTDGDATNGGSGQVDTQTMVVTGCDGEDGNGVWNGLSYYTLVVCEDALIEFDWLFETQDQDPMGFYDRAIYRINGVTTEFAWMPDATGHEAFAVSSGDVFDLGMWSQDGLRGAGTVTITNFLPEPSALVMLLLGSLVAARRR